VSFTLHGLGVSGGIAIGVAHLISHATLEVAHLTIAPRMVEKELARFDAALEKVRAELAAMKESTEHAPAEFGAFLDLHRMILDDPELCKVPQEIIRERRCNAEWALVQQMEQLVRQFDEFEDPYLRERGHDVRQVVERVIKELAGHPGRASVRAAKGVKEENLIVVAHDQGTPLRFFHHRCWRRHLAYCHPCAQHGGAGSTRPAERPPADPR
jgi:phosphoenolpyruvate-protein phosphotransferase (PTS system enzyme I)